VKTTDPVSFPFWHLESPDVNLELQSLCPMSNPLPVSKAIANEFIDRNVCHSFAIYTDSSKTYTGETGAAFTLHCTHTVDLPYTKSEV
ncbi:hypothetical protein ScPMuIL_000402, partial [Solemya velum]